MKDKTTIKNIGFRQGSMANHGDKNPYSIHTSPEWYSAWEKGYEIVWGKECPLRKKMLERAEYALKVCEEQDQPPATVMYDVLRYAKAGLYQLKG